MLTDHCSPKFRASLMAKNPLRQTATTSATATSSILVVVLIACGIGSGIDGPFVSAATGLGDRKQLSELATSVGSDDATSSDDLGGAVDSSAHELCQWENMNAECSLHDEVLLVTGAIYGRYRLGGRCIQRAYGKMACGFDALDQVASLCSARQRCTFPVMLLHRGLMQLSGGGSAAGVGIGGGRVGTADPEGACPLELSPHLLVKYTCLKVAYCERYRPAASAAAPGGCDHWTETLLKATSERQYLTNLHSVVDHQQSMTEPRGTGSEAAGGARQQGNQVPQHLQPQHCGTLACPWNLHVEPGQRINVTLIHFSVTSNSESRPQTTSSERLTAGGNRDVGGVACHRYAAVRESVVGGVTSTSSSYHDLTACGTDHINFANDDGSSLAVSWRRILERGSVRREKQTYLSSTNTVQLAFYAVVGVHVIVSYEAVGCPLLTNVPDSIRIKYPGDDNRKEPNWSAIVDCQNEAASDRKQKWRLHCVGNRWILDDRRNHVTSANIREVFRSCSERQASATDNSEADTAGMVDRTKSNQPSYGILVVIGLGIALGVAVGFSLLLVVLRCIRRDNGTFSGDAADSGSPVHYWKPPAAAALAVKYDVYGTSRTPTDLTAGSDVITRQVELFSDVGSCTGLCRHTPDYYRAAVAAASVSSPPAEGFDLIDSSWRVSSTSALSAQQQTKAAVGGRHFVSAPRDFITSYNTSSSVSHYSDQCQVCETTVAGGNHETLAGFIEPSYISSAVNGARANF